MIMKGWYISHLGGCRGRTGTESRAGTGTRPNRDPDGHRDPSLRVGTGTRPHNAGVTLVELIVAMVVISVALTGVLLVINYTTLHSADPVLRHQAIAIAEAYMEEITLKNFSDPDVDGEGSRALYDDVDDYDGLSDSGAVDQNGNAITGLENYAVEVSVQPQNYGPTGDEVAGLRIDVTVTDPAGEDLTLSGYRADY